MDGIYNIREWLERSLKKVANENVVVDKHINEFIGLFSEADILKSAENIFVKCVEELTILNTTGISIYLSIELKSRSRKPSCGFKSYEDIKSQLQLSMMPEIIIYCPTESEVIPFVEIHRVPVIRSVLYLGSKVNIFLKENRTMDDILENRVLQKELLFIYNP